MKQVGPYVVESVLGRGAMGQVFLVHHPELDQRYALKVLPQALMDDDDSFARFEREMSALGQVDGHPGIVRVHTAGRTEEGQPYYVMELVEGRTLKDALKEGMPREEVLLVLEQIADALDHAHLRGLIHRDVKPANVLLGDDGVVRLTDFGLARITSDAQAEKLTRTGDMVGTPAYMAPEQASPRLGDVGPWTDVWGAGAILYEALAGHVPYPGQTSVEIYGKLVEGYPIPPPSQEKPDVPPELDALCMRCLERRPEQRIESAAELRDLLRGLRLGEPEAKPRLASTTALLAVVAGLSLLLAGLALGALALRSRQRSDERVALDEWISAREGELEATRAQGDPMEKLRLAELLLARRDGTPEGAQARLKPVYQAAEQLRRDALRLAVEESWAAGDVRLAGERDKLASEEGIQVPARPWILALGGDPSAALALLGDGLPAERARLAAWAGDLAGARRALEQLAAAEKPRAAALSLHLALQLPGLEPIPVDEKGTPAAWWPLIRAEQAFLSGDAGLAAAILVRERERIELDGEARLLAAWLDLRVRLARRDLAGALELLRTLWATPQVRDDPLQRSEVLGWALLLSRLPGGPPVALEGLSDLRAESLRQVPCDPVGLLQRGAGDAARRALRASQGKQAVEQELVRAGVPPGLCERSTALAELWLARSGRDGPFGLLLARAADLADATLAGGLQGGEEAVADAQAVIAVLPDSGAALIVLSRAARAARQGQTASAAAQAAGKLLPKDPLALLEQARALLGQLEAGRIAAGHRRAAEAGLEERELLARAAETGHLEGQLADGLGDAARLFGEARSAAKPLDELYEEALLEGAAALIERAHRLSRSGREAAAVTQGREAALEAARDELGPLLSQVGREKVLLARRGLSVVLGRDPEALEDQADLRRAELELADAGRGVSEHARAAAALAASCAASEGEARSWAEAYLALAGDLPARALLALRQAEEVEGNRTRAEEVPERRARRLEFTKHATNLLPLLPRTLVSVQGTLLDPSAGSRPPGLAPGSAMQLARVLLGDPDELDHARRLLDPLRDDQLAPSLEQLASDEQQRDADPATAHLARALLLLEVGSSEAEKDPARAEQAVAAAGAALRLRPSAAAHLLRARALSRLAAPAACDALHDLACARARAPWSAPAALLELTWTDTEETKGRLESLLASGYVRNTSILAEALPAPSVLDDLRKTLGNTDLSAASGQQALGWAGWFHRNSFPRVAMLLRLRAQVEGWNVYDLLGEQPDAEAKEPGPTPEVSLAALDDRLEVVARALWWLHRSRRVDHARDWTKVEKPDDEKRRLRRDHALRSVEAGCDALGAAPLGAPGLLPDTARMGGQGVPCEGRIQPEREARLIHPDEDKLRAWWARLHRPEQAAIARSRAWATLRGGSAPALFSQADLADPWSRTWALLRAVQDGDTWSLEELVAAGELDEARLALDREVAFSRDDDPEGTYLARLQWTLRWSWAPDEAKAARFGLALRAARTPMVRRFDGSRFDRLAADLHLDLAGAEPKRAAYHVAAARRLFDLTERDRDRGRGRDAADHWRQFRLAAWEGNKSGAALALGKVEEEIAEGDEGDIWSALANESKSGRQELETRCPEVKKLFAQSDGR